MTARITKLTIFHKMLVAPILGLLLYSVFLAYSYNEHRLSSLTIETVHKKHLPALELASENILLFSKITDQLKDAVLASEKEWIENTRTDKKNIEKNLKKIRTYSGVVPDDQINKLLGDFYLYYKNAYALSLEFLNNTANADERNTLINNVKHFTHNASERFDSIKLSIQSAFTQRINETNERLHQLTMVGVVIGILLIFVIVSVTFVLSISTRRSLREVINPLKDIATGQADFSKRLAQHSQDEMGELVKWFNVLSEKLEQDHKKIELLSITDKLTQLFNRTKIDDVFQNELSTAERYGDNLSIILIDLDHFKEVNDTHGHQVGDIILQELAGILKNNVRKTDYVGRWGGEEFIIITPRTNLKQAIQQAEKLRQTIADFKFTAIGKKTASFGVASYHNSDEEKTMTKRADDCLYIAKENGRNQVVDENRLKQ